MLNQWEEYDPDDLTEDYSERTKFRECNVHKKNDFSRKRKEKRKQKRSFLEKDEE